MSQGTIYRDEGVVLRTWKLGEADRIVVIATKRRGKVRAVAKGVRKTKSKFGARLEPTSHVALQLYEGRELDIVTQAETIDHFPAVRDDLDRLTRAVSMLEVVDQVAQEREPSPRLYEMLVGALRALSQRDGPLVAPAFFFKLLALEGYRPVVEACVECGEGPESEPPVDLVSFDPYSGGTLCRSCRRGPAVSADALDLLQRILGGRLASALDEPPSSATHEVDRLATHTVEHHLERRLRSISLIE